ncbi:MAG: S-layer protein, partial [Planctomycetia bacterium 21-64-5]
MSSLIALCSALLGLCVPSVVDAGERTVSFVNEIVPVLTKAGCNAGVCHAKAGNGQNGFQLSLLGFEPLDDYEQLVKKARGRRLSFASPDHSLILLKASAQVPHGGGRRLGPSSEGYALLRTWIAQGAPLGSDAEPRLESFEVQ